VMPFDVLAKRGSPCRVMVDCCRFHLALV
jgi:hypothetical protein